MRVIYFSILFSALCSCGSKEKADSPTFRNLTTDSFFVNLFDSQTEALNLSKLKNGVDSFELRVWHGIGMSTPKHLVILRYSGSDWKLTSTTYWLRTEWHGGTLEKTILDSSFTKSLEVPLSISTIVDSILKFRLDTFPSQSEIPGFQDRVADGFIYRIEIATRHYYKLIGYNNPDRYDDAYNRKVTSLIRSLSDLGVWNLFKDG